MSHETAVEFVKDIWATDRFAYLFMGREHVYGTDSGGSRRTEVSIQEMIWRHLNQEPIGIYPMSPHNGDWACWWGCVDFDIKSDHHKTYDYETETDAHVAACNLAAILQYLGCEPWLERTRSGGRHVWVFSDRIEVRSMRRALLVACAMAGVSDREVNPKAEAFDLPDTLGNYVRLPYGYGASQTMIDTHNNPIGLKGFLEVARRSSSTAIHQVAQRWTPPPKPIIINYPNYTPSPHDDAYLTAAVQGGPAEGQDRSSWLLCIAQKAADRKLSVEQALQWVERADQMVGKYVNRQDRDRRLRQIVELAYSA